MLHSIEQSLPNVFASHACLPDLLATLLLPNLSHPAQLRKSPLCCERLWGRSLTAPVPGRRWWYRLSGQAGRPTCGLILFSAQHPTARWGDLAFYRPTRHPVTSGGALPATGRASHRAASHTDISCPARSASQARHCTARSAFHRGSYRPGIPQRRGGVWSGGVETRPGRPALIPDAENLQVSSWFLHFQASFKLQFQTRLYLFRVRNWKSQ